MAQPVLASLDVLLRLADAHICINAQILPGNASNFDVILGVVTPRDSPLRPGRLYLDRGGDTYPYRFASAVSKMELCLSTGHYELKYRALGF